MTAHDFWVTDADTNTTKLVCPHGTPPPTLAVVSAWVKDEDTVSLTREFTAETHGGTHLCAVDQALQFMEYVASCGWEVGDEKMHTSRWFLPHEISGMKMMYHRGGVS